MERSYLEVKVSFIHVTVLLVGIILIGSFLFYLGYQAGKSSIKGDGSGEYSDSLNDKNNTEEIQLTDARTNKGDDGDQKPRTKPSIQDELKMHQLPVETKQEEKPLQTENTADNTETVKSKPIQNTPAFAVQVGAFSDYQNAKKYSTKFAGMGYPTEILSTNQGRKKTLPGKGRQLCHQKRSPGRKKQVGSNGEKEICGGQVGTGLAIRRL
jgi:hypothetical protein